MSKLSFYRKFIVIVILDVISALAARYAFNHDSLIFMIISITSIPLAAYFFMSILPERITIVVNAIWIALGSINVTLASYLVFGEKITLKQAMGMLIIILGLITIEAFHAEKKEMHISQL